MLLGKRVLGHFFKPVGIAFVIGPRKYFESAAVKLAGVQVKKGLLIQVKSCKIIENASSVGLFPGSGIGKADVFRRFHILIAIKILAHITQTA
ncbi:hypothetical protein D3C87_1471550 [compost metagenome]